MAWKKTFLEVASMVVTWWIVFSHSVRVAFHVHSSQYNNSGYMTMTGPYFEMYNVHHYKFICQTCLKGRTKFADNLKAITHNNHLWKVPAAMLITCFSQNVSRFRGKRV